MEFDEIKMIWDQQNEEPLYAINQEAMHRGIKSRLGKSRQRATTNEIGLFTIFLGTGIGLFFSGSGTIFSYLTIASALGIAVFMLIARRSRRRREDAFESSMLGDLEHAISNENYMMNGIRKFHWLVILPIAIPTLLDLYFAEKAKELWNWAFVIGSFVLSYLVVQVGLRKVSLPRLRKLEELREKLVRFEEEKGGG